MHQKLKSRYLASLLHFSISLFIFSIFVVILLNAWYPTPYFTASGGWQGLKIVAAIDLVLGPILTLVVYNINKPKKELYTDLSIIALMQIAALCWGIVTVYDQRPIAAVFWEDGFYTVPASALTDQGVKPDELNKYGSGTPLYIFAELPQTDEERDEMIDLVLNKEIPPHHQITRFRPIDSHYDDIFRHKLDIAEIIDTNAGMKEEIYIVLEKTNSALDDNYYIPLKSKYRNIILIFNQKNQLIGTASAPYKDQE